MRRFDVLIGVLAGLNVCRFATPQHRKRVECTPFADYPGTDDRTHKVRP
ncbi:hypothetical protein [Pseudomonas sp. YJ42]|jgi:hypothetical protein